MTDGPALKECLFEEMAVGEELGPLELVVDDHAIKRCAFTGDDYHPWFLADPAVSGTPFGERVAHAAILVPDLLRLLNTRYDPNTDIGLHQKEEVWFASPVRLDEPVVLTGSFTDKYVKRDKGYIVTDAEARSQIDGRLLVRHRSIEVARVDPGIAIGGASSERSATTRYAEAVFPTDREPAARVVRGIAVGTPFVGPAKTLHQDQMSVFSNVQAFWHNIHTDIEVARVAGSDRTIAQGLMLTLAISELGTRLFGASWHTTGWTSHTFLQPVHAGDVLTPKAVVVEPPAPEAGRVELEVWLENQDGVKVVVGWLSAVADD